MTEIEEAWKLYCRDELSLSSVYLPSAFRSLLIYILAALFKKPEIWLELSTSSFDVDG